jgi:hypothetical protein
MTSRADRIGRAVAHWSFSSNFSFIAPASRGAGPRDAVRTMFPSAIDALVIVCSPLMKDYWFLRSEKDL